MNVNGLVETSLELFQELLFLAAVVLFSFALFPADGLIQPPLGIQEILVSFLDVFVQDPGGAGIIGIF